MKWKTYYLDEVYRRVGKPGKVKSPVKITRKAGPKIIRGKKPNSG